MKKALFFLLFNAGVCLQAAPAFAAVIKVLPHPNSIIKAINAAHKGDTLFIQKGLYKEHDIVIKKGLVLIGIGFPVIDAESKYQVFIIRSDSVVIEGLQIQNVGTASLSDMAGIKIINAKNITIENNRLINNTFGVYLQNSTLCKVIGNTIHCDIKDQLNGGNGINAWKSDHLLIVGNAISGHRDGVYFEFVTNSKVTGNISYSNVRYGLHFMFSHNDTYTQNTFKDNGAGVAVMYSKGVIMYDNDFLHNWGDASDLPPLNRHTLN